MDRLGPWVVSIAVLALVAPLPAAAQQYDPIEAWEATAVQMDIGKMIVVRVGVEVWSTTEERAALIQIFEEGGSEAAVKYLHDQDEKGYVQFPESAAYQMRYAFQSEHEGKRYVVMATDRPVGNIQLRQAADTWENNISLLTLELDPETGKGTGTLVAGADITLDAATGQVKIEHVGTQPIRFTSVKQAKIKDKKK